MNKLALNWQIFGPLTLLVSFALTSVLPLSSFPFDLYLAGGFGLYFSSRWHLKGCSYALILLALAGIIGHGFFEVHHFFRLGLEASFACSFFITALSFESESEKWNHLESQLVSRESSIQNLEEELSKVRELALDAQMSNAQRIEELQKNYDELSAEKSSLEILNDVLRKANATHFEEKMALTSQIQEENQSLASAVVELQEVKVELTQLKSIDFVAENRSLFKELNQARFDKEQTRLINETLVRLHAKESVRAKEADDLLKATLEEKRMIEEQVKDLQEQSAEEKRRLEQQVIALQAIFEEKRESSFAEIEKSGKLGQTERNDLQNQIASLEKKIQELIQVEFLYKQLKEQFGEKTKVLHEARSALFKAETEVQTMAREKEEGELLLPDLLRSEFDRLDEEIGELQEENKLLQDLVTHLTERFPQPLSFATHRTPLPAGQLSLEETLREALTPKRKKKTKKPAQQDLLF